MAGNRRSRAEKKPATQRLNAQIREGSLQRLMLHVVMMKQNPGDILSDLIDAHLREYRVQKNSAARATLEGSANLDDQREQTLPEAA
jgi:hypothetical protein